jgi:hypothetical protein
MPFRILLGGLYENDETESGKRMYTEGLRIGIGLTAMAGAIAVLDMIIGICTGETGLCLLGLVVAILAILATFVLGLGMKELNGG